MDLSFDELNLYTTEDHVRVFLGVSASAARRRFAALTNCVNGVLERFDLPGFFANPDPHLSVAFTEPGPMQPRDHAMNAVLRATAGAPPQDSNKTDSVRGAVRATLAQVLELGAPISLHVTTVSAQIGRKRHVFPLGSGIQAERG